MGDLELPKLAPTRERVVTVLAEIMESRDLDRFYCTVQHAGPLGHWILDHRWIGHAPFTAELTTEMETTLIAPLEAAIMTRWGIQALLL